MADGRVGRTSGESHVVIGDVLGAKELSKALNACEAEVKKAFRKRLRAAGQIIRKEIQSRTPVSGRTTAGRLRYQAGANLGARGKLANKKLGRNEYDTSHRSGTLKRGTKIQVLGTSVKVYNDAKRRSQKYPGGYRYGKRIEFDPAYSGRYAFFYPGVEASLPKARAEWQQVIEDIQKVYMEGG